MNAPANLTPDPTTGLVTVTAGYTPSSHVHTPDSTYAQLSGREGVSHEGE